MVEQRRPRVEEEDLRSFSNLARPRALIWRARRSAFLAWWRNESRISSQSYWVCAHNCRRVRLMARLRTNVFRIESELGDACILACKDGTKVTNIRKELVIRLDKTPAGPATGEASSRSRGALTRLGSPQAARKTSLSKAHPLSQRSLVVFCRLRLWPFGTCPIA